MEISFEDRVAIKKPQEKCYSFVEIAKNWLLQVIALLCYKTYQQPGNVAVRKRAT